MEKAAGSSMNQTVSGQDSLDKMEQQQLQSKQAYVTDLDLQMSSKKSMKDFMEMTTSHNSEKNESVLVEQFDFQDLSYQVRVKGAAKQQSVQGMKQILSNVSGTVHRGDMVALMGPSGSGKTSLLNVLAQRVDQSSVSGKIFINGLPVTKSWKRRMGFVFQDDLMLSNLTVRETIMYSAKLRLPQSMPTATKEAKVDALLDLLSLQKCAHSKIGSEGKRGISGGERKRTAIGVELITSPSIVFLDEPTSGLDSTTALQTVTLLKELTSLGTVFISSIHQPRANIFYQFHKVLLLQSGTPVYFGSTGNVLDYFSSQGLHVPPLTNPADWLLDVIVGNSTTKDGSELSDAWKSSSDSSDTSECSGAPASHISSEDVTLVENGDEDDAGRKWSTSFWYQFLVLYQRSAKQSSGENFDRVNVLGILLTAACMCAMWFQATNLKDLVGLLFFLVLNQPFSMAATVCRIFPKERSLMMRERSTGSYQVGPYFLAKTCSDLTAGYVVPTIYAIMVYCFCGLYTGSVSHFFLYMAIFWAMVMTGQSYGYFWSAAVTDLPMANMLVFTTILFMVIAGGFYIPMARLPTGLQWLPYLSFIYWGYSAIMALQFEGNTYDCTKARPFEYGADCPITGENVIKKTGFDDAGLGMGLGMVVFWAILYRILAYIFLRMNTRTKM
uniref:ABC transporter domain-containing protein n=1 Tax=Fibrocapsa japonica TaxID=94617 RepID=A0A6U1MQ19_9STRA|mmetsp:Transcript_16570/g.24364  ORF Transcript_16570/g.24364 Transcript_16570/m.24364 type:complete len:669 (+) Transcript_16570:84-2090(+)